MIEDNCTASQDILSTIEIFAIYVIVDKSQFHIPCDAMRYNQIKNEASIVSYLCQRHAIFFSKRDELIKNRDETRRK